MSPRGSHEGWPVKPGERVLIVAPDIGTARHIATEANLSLSEWAPVFSDRFPPGQGSVYVPLPFGFLPYDTRGSGGEDLLWRPKPRALHPGTEG